MYQNIRDRYRITLCNRHKSDATHTYKISTINYFQFEIVNLPY